MMLFGLVTGKTTISLSGASPLLFVGEIMKKYAVRQIESKEKFCCEITVKRHDVKQILQEAKLRGIKAQIVKSTGLVLLLDRLFKS